MTEQGIGVLPGLWPIHGDGVLARQGGLVLLIHPAGGAFTDRLLDLLTDAARAGEPGLRFASLISAEFDSDAAAASGQSVPAAVAFGPAGDGLAIAIYGTAWAEDHDGPRHAAADGGPALWPAAVRPALPGDEGPGRRAGPG